MKNQGVAANRPGERVPLGRIILYNLAGFSFNLYEVILYTWLPFFYLPPKGSGQIQLMPIAAFGLILAGGRIVDAITDPLMGYLSDRTRSRWGRRKPYIAVSTPILFVSFLLVWAPPVAANSMTNALFLAAVLFFYYVSYTGVLIPWFAVLPEMSADNRERVKIASIGVAIGVLGALVGGALSGPLMDSVGIFSMALALGLLGLVAGGLTLPGVVERPERSADAPSPGLVDFFRILRQVFSDVQILSFSAAILFVQLTYQLMLMNVPYLTTLILGRPKADASILMGEVIGITAISTPLWYALLSRFPKRRVFRVIIAVMAGGFALSFFIGRIPWLTPFTQALIIFPVTAAAFGGMFTAVLGLISDITDYDELKTGRRNEAIYFGIYGIVRKSGWAACSLILTGTFGLFGYSVENPAGVQVIWLICAASCLVGLAAFLPYRIGDTREETARVLGLDTETPQFAKGMKENAEATPHP